MKSNSEFAAWLKEKRACDEAVIWIANKSTQEVWETCERGDWLLWWCC